MRRVLVFDRFDAQVCELAENDVFELTRHEVVNGEHELSITTTQVLEKGWRVVMQDDRGYWHEWVVSGIDDTHANGSRPYGSYYCVWSLQPDLMGTRVSAMPGVQTPVTAAQALDAVLSGTSRWTRGTITNANTGGASMYDTDGWSAMSTLVANWRGEVDTTISVSSSGVVSRQVDLYAQQGESTAKRRFDFGADLVSVRRTIADDPLYCRITPRGKGEETGGGYGRKITIESVNGGKDYLVNNAMVDLAKLPDGNGGWEYPTLEVENSSCETPSELLAWSQGVLEEYTTPKITYEVNVVQAAMEGVDFHGVSLGDSVQIVDGKFNDLRMTGRVVEMTTDELAHTATSLTIGHIGAGIAGRFSDLYDGIRTAELSVTQLSESLATSDYIDDLLTRINAEVNATGGYVYITQGQGFRTYDVAVTDPLVGSEASSVVEIKGGTIRIANSKDAQGQWEWKTVFQSGHILAELVTAANLVSGTIGNASGDFFIDMDNAVFRMPAMTVLGDVTAAQMYEMIETTYPNLLDDTNAPSLTKERADYNRYIENAAASGYTSTIEQLTDAPEPNIVYGQHLVNSGSSVGFHSVAYYQGGTVTAVKPGKTYTMSAYVKHHTAMSNVEFVLQYAFWEDGTAKYRNNKTILPNDTEWHRISWTFTTPDYMDDVGIRAYPGGVTSANCNVYICGWMLQEGENMTGWELSLSDVEFANTMVRPYGDGVLVCRQGNAIGALVNSAGSFDVVQVTWSGNTPTAGTVYATYGTTTTIGKSNAAHVTITDSEVTAQNLNATGTITSQSGTANGATRTTITGGVTQIYSRINNAWSTAATVQGIVSGGAAQYEVATPNSKSYLRLMNGGFVIAGSNGSTPTSMVSGNANGVTLVGSHLYVATSSTGTLSTAYTGSIYLTYGNGGKIYLTVVNGIITGWTT